MELPQSPTKLYSPDQDTIWPPTSDETKSELLCMYRALTETRNKAERDQLIQDLML